MRKSLGLRKKGQMRTSGDAVRIQSGLALWKTPQSNASVFSDARMSPLAEACSDGSKAGDERHTRVFLPTHPTRYSRDKSDRNHSLSSTKVRERTRRQGAHKVGIK